MLSVESRFYNWAEARAALLKISDAKMIPQHFEKSAQLVWLGPEA
jgi:hypothetical protein